RLRKGEQGVWVSTFKHDCRLQSCHTAGRIERTAKSESTVHQEQRTASEMGNLDCAAATERRRGVADRQQLNRPERKATEMALIELDSMQQVLAEVNFSAFEHRQNLAARSLGNLYLNLGIALRVTVQE